jgi:hypothetical protein
VLRTSTQLGPVGRRLIEATPAGGAPVWAAGLVFVAVAFGAVAFGAVAFGAVAFDTGT